MAKPNGMELRDRVVKFVLGGESRHEAARRLGFGAATVIRSLDKLREDRVGGARDGGHRKPKIIGEWRD